MDNSSDSEVLPQASESQASSMPRPLIQSPTPRELLPHIPIGHPDSMMSRESVRRAVEEFQTRPSDIIVATFPKTGTTLITWICHLLRTNALPIEENDGTENSFETLYEVVPWPTLSWDIGYDPNVQGSQFTPRVFKSHLRMASIYSGCKYVVTVRDPAKTTLSFYNFFLAKKVPFLVDASNDGSDCKPKVDVSTFLVDMPFVKGSPQTPTTNLRASIWDYYAEYHALLECPDVLILVYEDFLKDMPSQIRQLSQFMGISDTLSRAESDDLIDRVVSLSTKDYMARHMSKFDEPYERAKKLNRAADISQLAPGAKVAVKTHKQTLDDRAQQFLEDRWSSQMGQLGYEDYGSFAKVVRERNQRLFGTPQYRNAEVERNCNIPRSLVDDDRIDILLFDLDGTLYDHACGYEQEIHSNIFKFMVETKGGKFDAITTIEEAERAWTPIFDKYNLTKRGLIGEGYVFDSRHYDSYIRKGAEKYFSPDEELRRFLESFPSRMKKVVFTNAPESSANEILTLLGVRDLFDDVLGTDFLDSKVCKPELAAFSKVLNHLFSTEDDSSPTSSSLSEAYQDRNRRICYFEDSFKNLKVGKELGFRTVFVTSETLLNEGKSSQELQDAQFDAIIPGRVSAAGLRSQLPQLWID